MKKQFKEKFKLKTDYYGGVKMQYDYCPSKKRMEPQGNLCSENRQFEDMTRSLQPQGSLREKQNFLGEKIYFCVLPSILMVLCDSHSSEGVQKYILYIY